MFEYLNKGIADNQFNDYYIKTKKSIAFKKLYNKVSEGGTPNTGKLEYYGNGTIPFIKIDDLSNKYLTAHQWSITELGLKNSSAWIIPKNSIIFSNGATIGEASITTYPITTKQGILGIVLNDNELIEFIYYLLKSKCFKKEVARITTRGTMKMAYLKDIDYIRGFFPDKNNANKLVDTLKTINVKIEREKQLLKSLIELRKYLFQNLFI